MLKQATVAALGAVASWIALGSARADPPSAVARQAQAGGALKAQRPAGDAAAKRVEIIVERQKGGRVEAMDPNHVFDAGELVRFRFRASFNGYLYVMNHSTSGQYVLLFPKEETGRQNRIESGREYLVPMTESGWFRLEGPPGHEVVYWLVSPVKLSESEASRPAVAKLPAPARPLNPSITPRCDDAIFRARGECIDNTAGLKALKKDTPLPENLAGFNAIKARDLTMVKINKAAAVSAADESDEPFIYTLRLAHR